MDTLFIGQKIIRPEQTDSTNSHLLRLLAEQDLLEGTVVITEQQEAGRGQRGTQWQSELDKNLTLSILFKPHFLKADEQFLLSKAISLAILNFITISISPILRFPPSEKETERGRNGGTEHISIKWPNDIYIGNKKVAGILIENSLSGNSISHSVIGIGINVNQEKFPSELQNPTSLKLIAGKEFDLERCLAELCSFIEKKYLQLRNHSKDIDTEYQKNIYRFEEWADYNYKGEVLKAKIIGVSKTGKLVLKKENQEVLECDLKEINFE